MAQLRENQKGWFAWSSSLRWVLLIGGLVGLVSSFALTYDKLQVLQNPEYKPACSLNPVISCGSVMSSPQSDVLGVPNPIFGLIAFSALATFGGLLVAGATFPKWVWLGAQIAATGGVIFMHYLFFQSVFYIHAICPWCFVVWMVTIAIFWGITVHNLRSAHLGKWHKNFTKHISRYSSVILASWYAAIFTTLLTHFWYYWKTLF